MLDMVCRYHTGFALPTDVLCAIMVISPYRHRRTSHREARASLVVTDFVERGSRVKRLKSKVRIKRAFRHS